MKPIDAVISWVDGDEPEFQNRLREFCLQKGLKQSEKIEPTRIQQRNEIYYCLHSLQKFAPWLRKIYIITNSQSPKVVNCFKQTPFGEKIQLIDQNDLLRTYCQPVSIFNSIGVEWLIWLIPGLSEQFIYLNDDFFLLRRVNPEDFFRGDKSIFRGKWKVQTNQKMSFILKNHLLRPFAKNINVNDNPHRSWQEKSARLAGWQKYFYLLPHAPTPLNRNTFNCFHKFNPNLFYENLQFPFRDEKQTSSIPLMVHKEIKEERVIFDDKLQAIMVNGACHRPEKIKRRLHQAKKNNKITFLCIQSMDQAPLETQSFMINWLEQNIINSKL